jgi:hypothetical protein
MPTTEQAKMAWNHGRKSEKHYNALTTEQKSAFWYYGRDNGLVDKNNLGDFQKSEYDRYVFKKELQYAPNVYKNKDYGTTELKANKDNLSRDLKADKYAGYTGPTVPLDKKYTFPDNKLTPTQNRLETAKIVSKLTPAQKEVYADSQPEPLSIPKQSTKTLVVGKGKKVTVTPQAKIAPKDLVKPENGLLKAVGTGAMAVADGFNNVLQTIPTIATRGGQGVDIAKANGQNQLLGAIKGIGTGIKDSVTGNVVTNTESIEQIAPKTTAELKAKYPKAYNVASTLAEFVGVDDVIGLGIISDIAKVRKLNDLPTSTKALNELFSKIKTNAPLTVAEQAIVKENPDLISIIRKDLGIESGIDSLKTSRVVDDAVPQPIIKPQSNVLEMPKVEVKPLANTNVLPSQQNVLKKAVGDSVTSGGDEVAATVMKEVPKTKPRRVSNNVYELQRTITELETTGQTANPLYQEARTQLDEVSKLYDNTLKNANFLTDVEKKALNVEDFTYDIKSELESLANARRRISTNLNGEIQNLYTKQAYTGEDFDTAMEILKDKFLNEARQTGNYSQVRDWLQNIRKFSTEAGRAVQAHAKYSKTPEGMATAAQRMVDKANDALRKQNPKLYELKKAKGELQELADNDIKDIITGMEKYEQLPDGWDKQAELAKVQKLIADKLPPTMIDKYKGIQRIAFLLNPKTLFTRNGLGNLVLQSAETIKDIPGTLVDSLTSLKTKQRTTNLPNLGRLEEGAKGFKQGFSDAVKDMRANVNTSPTQGQAEIQKARVFKNNVLNKLDETVSKALQLGDRPFYQSAYNDRIMQLKQINKTDVVTDTMKLDAEEFALERTFQNDTEISKVFSKIKKASDNPIYQVFINTVLPFTKTPANILNKLVEYTPAGFVKSMVELGTSAKTGRVFNQKYFVDNIGRSLTGTGLLALGYAGAKNGFITGKADKDKEVASIERLMGIQPYAFVTKDGSYTFDWAQPVSALLAIGADAYYAGKTKDTFAEQLQAGAEAAGNTFFNMSMLQGMTRLFNQYNPAAGVIDSLTGGVTGLGAPTILNQTTKVLDPFVRETQGSKFKQTQAKIPGLSQNLPAKLDLFGRPIEQFQGRGIANKALESYLSPGYYASTKNSTPELKEAYRVYKSTGEKNIFPRLAPKEITDKGQPIRLTIEEQQSFQKEMGDKNLRELKALINSGPYRLTSDENKAEMLRKLIDANYNETRKRFLNKIKSRLKTFK